MCPARSLQQGAQSPGSEAAKQGVWAKPGGPWGWGPWGSPFGPTFAGRRGNRFYFGESIRKKELRGDYRFKEVVGARSTTAEGFFLEKLRVNTRPGDAV